jgi:hypothetical protein
MFTWLRFLTGSSGERKSLVEHPSLGTLTYDESSDAWRCVVRLGSSSLSFRMKGQNAPDDRLLAHAASIAEDAPAFLASVNTFLASEAIKLPKWAEEIGSLKVKEICLFWPSRPNDGMLFFSTPTDVGRYWHADYIERRLVGLAFDG